MGNLKFEIYSKLKDLARTLEITISNEDIDWKAKIISEKMTWSQFIIAKEYLEKNYTYQGFPKLPHFQKAYMVSVNEKKRINEGGSGFESWQYDCAGRLGLPVERLPSHASLLTSKQRAILDIPTEEERIEIFQQIYVNLGDKKMSMSQTQRRDHVKEMQKEEFEDCPF